MYAYGNCGRRITRLTKILTSNPSQRKAVQEIVKRVLLSFVAKGGFRENLGSYPRSVNEPPVPDGRQYVVSKLWAGEHKKLQRGENTMRRWEFKLDDHYVIYEAFPQSLKGKNAGRLTTDLLVACAPGSGSSTDGNKVLGLGATVLYAVQNAMKSGPSGCRTLLEGLRNSPSDANQWEE